MGKLEESILQGLVCLSEENSNTAHCMFVFPLDGMTVKARLFGDRFDVAENGPVALVCALPECAAAV